MTETCPEKVWLESGKGSAPDLNSTDQLFGSRTMIGRMPRILVRILLMILIVVTARRVLRRRTLEAAAHQSTRSDR